MFSRGSLFDMLKQFQLQLWMKMSRSAIESAIVKIIGGPGHSSHELAFKLTDSGNYQPLEDRQNIFQIPVGRRMYRCSLNSGISNSYGIVLPCAPGVLFRQLFNDRNIILQYINEMIHIKYIHEWAAEKHKQPQEHYIMHNSWNKIIMQQNAMMVSAITLNPSTQDLIQGMGSQELHSVSLQQQLHHISKQND